MDKLEQGHRHHRTASRTVGATGTSRLIPRYHALESEVLSVRVLAETHEQAEPEPCEEEPAGALQLLPQGAQVISVKRQIFHRYVVTCTTDCRSDVTELFSAGAYPSRGVWCEASDGEVKGHPELISYVLIVNAEDTESVRRVERLVRE
jgi:hypothetical protein